MIERGRARPSDSDDRGSLLRLLECARGERRCDLLLTGARVVDVLGGEIVEMPVAVAEGRIVGLGERPAHEVVDLRGGYVAPGLIDAHVHVESSMVPPDEMARAVVPRGTTTLIADPHEIANVHGLAGIRFMLERAAGAELDVLVMAPSCVPASDMETNGALLEAEELAELLDEPGVLGLGEVMNYPGVVSGDSRILAKLRSWAGRPIDGHAPGVEGAALEAYVAAGPSTDHECLTADEVRARLRAGMTVLLREASNARNLEALLPAITPYNVHRLCLCTDDRTPRHLLDEGHVDDMVRRTIAAGVDPITALALGSTHAAAHYGLRDRGAVAPGRRADLIVFDRLERPEPRLVLRGGRVVARDGEPLFERRASGSGLPSSVRVAEDCLDFRLPASGSRARVIGAVADQLVTRHLVEEIPAQRGAASPLPERDLLRISVVERHRASGAVGHGFVRGLGLRRGALASTVAHDHHNLVVAGADERSMATAARRAIELDGGLVVAEGEQVVAELPLPLAGLMSPEPIERVAAALDRVTAEARRLGSPLRDPFMALSFLALEVIPELKLTDRGLIDVERFAPVPLWVS